MDTRAAFDHPLFPRARVICARTMVAHDRMNSPEREEVHWNTERTIPSLRTYHISTASPATMTARAGPSIVPQPWPSHR